MSRLKTRIETEMAPYMESSSICLDMIDTLPEDKRFRVADWYEESSSSSYFNWESLYKLFQEEFEDKHAEQAAAEMVLRMEQGYSQLFHEFLRDSEYQISLSGGKEVYTDTQKTRLLKASLNNRLRRALIGIKLSEVSNYREWVAQVKQIAAELEGLADYRPKGSSQVKTRIGPPKSGSAQYHSETVNLGVDAEGDTKMSGTDAIIAALKEIKLQNEHPIPDFHLNTM